MTNEEIKLIALKQSAIEANCNISDFLSNEHKVTISKQINKARNYLKPPFFCHFISYGSNIIASVDKRIENDIYQYLHKYQIGHAFSTPNLLSLLPIFNKYNMTLGFMSEFYLPDVNQLKEISCEYKTRYLTTKDLKVLPFPLWSNALSEDNRDKDVLGIGAYNCHDELIGLAACSKDCETMWQIGVDVLPNYRKQGVATALTSKLAIEILNKGKVPFYCCAWGNLPSKNTAIKSSFLPTWIEFTAISKELANQIYQ